MDAMELMDKIARTYQALLGENLVGVYLHGSLAMDCFREEVSDIDFLVVVRSEPSQHQKEAMIETLLALSPKAPKKGFEMSVVVASCLKPFQYPTPFALHFSNRHLENAKKDITQYCEGMRGTDVDLAAHCAFTRARGRVVLGRPIADVFGEVSKADYLDSVWLDVENAVEDVSDEPVYVILNLCRTLGYLKTGEMMSKAQGGQWALDNLQVADARVAGQALNAYRSGGEITLPISELTRFCAKLLSMIKESKDA